MYVVLESISNSREIKLPLKFDETGMSIGELMGAWRVSRFVPDTDDAEQAGGFSEAEVKRRWWDEADIHLTEEWPRVIQFS